MGKNWERPAWPARKQKNDHESSVEGKPRKQPPKGALQKTLSDNIHAAFIIKARNTMSFLCIYSQGGPCDRGVATILKRRLALIHSTFAGVKKRPCVNSTPINSGGGCVNPHQSYAGEASQTLTTPTLAGLQRAPERSTSSHLEKCPTSPDFRSSLPEHISRFVGLIPRHLSPKFPGGG